MSSEMTTEERHDSLVAPQRAPLRTLGDALDSCAAEFTKDRFWADLAKPITRAKEEFGKAKAAATADEAAAARSVALQLIDHLHEQLQGSQDVPGNIIFRTEARLVQAV